MSRHLMKGNDAVIYGALMGGASHFFGYPITPASEIAHAAALLFTKTGRCFLQAEDEVNAINMVYGAASAGARVMTATSGPGLSLMAEGISYIAATELPNVIVDVQRAGPGLGNIWPEQSDYTTVVKGGSHGNYRNIVYAPNSVQELCDFTYRSFEIAEAHRMTVFILSDAYIGQMMEPVTLPVKLLSGKRHSWALYGDRESRGNLVNSILMNTAALSDLNWKLQEKYKAVKEQLTEYEEYETADADVLFVAYGICSRICQTSLQSLRKRGIKAGLLRPKTLFPFPSKRLRELASRVKIIIAAELSDGQMAEDVELAAECGCPVLRYNWLGGIVPSSEEIVERARKDLTQELS